MTAHYGEYLPWVIYLGSAIGTWRILTLAIVRLVAALTTDEARHRQCLEVLRLARRDAVRMPTYTISGRYGRDPHGPESHRVQLGLDQSTLASVNDRQGKDAEPSTAPEGEFKPVDMIAPARAAD